MEQNCSVSKQLPLDRELLFTLRNTSTLKQKVAKVFELLRDPVYRYLYRVLDNPEEAEDLDNPLKGAWAVALGGLLG